MQRVAALVTISLSLVALLVICLLQRPWAPPPEPEPAPVQPSYSVQNLTSSDLSDCAELNSLEAAVDQASLDADSSTRRASIAAYKAALQRWHYAHRGLQPSCRTEALGVALCRFGSGLPEVKAANGGALVHHWDKQMAELRDHLSIPSHCAAMHEKYLPDTWKPTVFTGVYYIPVNHIDRVLSDPEYSSVYAKAGHLAPPYGPLQQLTWPRYGFMWNKKRIQNLNHIRALRLALPGWDIANLEQVVEFGGGSGDLVATLRDLGFRGTHMVVDLPAMNLLHYYWLRYSGIAALLGSRLPCDTTLAKGQVIVESSADATKLACHIDHSLDSKSLFFATYSFTEADVLTRERIRPLIEKFGVVFLAFWPSWEDTNNDNYLQKMLDAGLESTHYTLSWHDYFNGFYLVARRRDLGPVDCNVLANCHWYTFHAWLPRGGVVRLITGYVVLSLGALGLGCFAVFRLQQSGAGVTEMKAQ